MFFNRPHKRKIADETRAGIRVLAYTVDTREGGEFLLELYSIEKYGFLKKFAEIRYTDIAKIKDLFADVERRIKDLMRPY